METIKSASASNQGGSTPKWKYDVFLSSIGDNPDPNGSGDSFTARLSTALQESGLSFFRDDDDKRRGAELPWELNLKAIEESRISIIIFTRNYTSSKWCLDVLEKIIKCMKTKSQVVIPAFADFYGSMLPKLTGLLGDASQNPHWRSHPWRFALTQVAQLPGIDRKSRPEADFMKDILNVVEANVYKKQNKKPFLLVKHQVGVNSRAEQICSLLKRRPEGPERVCLIGVYGQEGIGKTLLAKYVYNQIFENFEYFCFLSTDRQNSDHDPSGLALLQGTLPSEFSSKRYPYDQPALTEKEARYESRKVLIVFDNIDNLEQVESLARLKKKIGAGSRIIVTTRGEHFLDKLAVDGKFRVKKLNLAESLELFNFHAFGHTKSFEGFGDLPYNLVQRARGVPSAIEGLGSYLLGKSFPEWELAEIKISKIPYNRILQILSKPNAIDEYEDDVRRKEKDNVRAGESGSSSDPSQSQNIPQINSSRKKVIMMGARELLIKESDDPEKWRWTCSPKSSSVEVAELLSAEFLEVQGIIKSRMLSPWTNYAAFLVYKCGDPISGLQSAKATVRVLEKSNEVPYDEAKTLFIDSLPQLRNEDGWMEIRLGQFIICDENDDTVQVKLMKMPEINGQKQGLIINGIEFRPEGFEKDSKELFHKGKASSKGSTDSVSGSFSIPLPEIARFLQSGIGSLSHTAADEEYASSQGEDNPSSECALCRSESLEERLTGCGHVLEICEKCIDDETILEHKCPTCEEPFLLKDIMRLYL